MTAVLRSAAVAAGLALASAVAYWPALDGQFLNWDDVRYVTDRPEIRSLGWETFDWALTTFEFSNWHPLTWLSLAADHALYGLEPWGFHLTSLLLHAVNAALLFLALQMLTGAPWRSAAVAALFALHPTHVESVAWVSERKDVLSGFFAILALVAYARYARAGDRWAYAGLLAAFALALMSKSMVVTLPFALLLLDVWPLRRLGWPVTSWRVVWEKLPLLALAVGTGALTFAAQRAGGAVDIDPIPLAERLLNAVLSYGRYLALTVWPLSLSPWYSHPSLEGPGFSAVAVGASALALVGITAAAVIGFRRGPYALVGWLWFLGMLVPVIGIVQIGRQGMADRYTYLPHIGLFVAVVWSLGALPLWRRPAGRAAGAAAAVAVLLALGLLTARQTEVWSDSETLWMRTAEANPHSFVAQQAVAGQYRQAGDAERALEAYRRAAAIRSDVPLVHARIGELLARRGERDAAIEAYRRALSIRDTSFPNHNALGELLLARGELEAARRHFERAIELQPAFAPAHNNLGRVWMAEGRPDLAAEAFRAALRVNRNFAAARSNLERAEAALRSGMSVAP